MKQRESADEWTEGAGTEWINTQLGRPGENYYTSQPVPAAHPTDDRQMVSRIRLQHILQCPLNQTAAGPGR